jgi:6-phosphogluconate dehydrogenase
LHHPRLLPAEDHRGLTAGSPTWRTSCSTRTSRRRCTKAQENWRKVVGPRGEARHAACRPSARRSSYFDGYRSARLPANLLQAQRDYFGAHTYERTDKPRGEFFHIDWPEPSAPADRG